MHATHEHNAIGRVLLNATLDGFHGRPHIAYEAYWDEIGPQAGHKAIMGRVVPRPRAGHEDRGREDMLGQLLMDGRGASHFLSCQAVTQAFR